MDHLVLGFPDLERGIEEVAAQTGVRAALGGSHPGRGTHNALLGLGGRQYLELIARDPAQPASTPLMFEGLEGISGPRFVSWAEAVTDLDDVARRARTAGLDITGPAAGSRARSDGRLLTWQTLGVRGEGLDLLPFFIAWGSDTPHPSQDSPAGLTLKSFRIAHPQADLMTRVLTTLGVKADVVDGPAARLTAIVEGPKGTVTLG